MRQLDPPARPEGALEDTICAAESSIFSAGMGVRIQVWLPGSWARDNRDYVAGLNRWLDPTLWKLYHSVQDKVRPEDVPDPEIEREGWGSWFRGLLGGSHEPG